MDTRMIYGHRFRTSANIKQRAHELRQEMTPPEKVLWEHLHGRKLAGFKFRRQHLLGLFIADFYCAESRLVIELDGHIHDFQKLQNDERTHQFEEFNYRVIRFKNKEIELNITSTLMKIVDTLKLPSPQMGRRAGGEGSDEND